GGAGFHGRHPPQLGRLLLEQRCLCRRRGAARAQAQAEGSRAGPGREAVQRADPGDRDDHHGQPGLDPDRMVHIPAVRRRDGLGAGTSLALGAHQSLFGTDRHGGIADHRTAAALLSGHDAALNNGGGDVSVKALGRRLYAVAATAISLFTLLVGIGRLLFPAPESSPVISWVCIAIGLALIPLWLRMALSKDFDVDPE